MQGRILTAALAAMALLAGCIQSPAFTSDDKSEVTAMANHDLAENAAKAWNPDAQLAGLGTGEMDRAQDGMPADPHPGNGKAVVWTFLYLAGNESRAFAVAADGHLLSDNSSDSRAKAAEKGVVPLGEWKIDSPDAMAAAQKNESFATVAKAPNATFGEMLGREKGSDSPAVWYLLAFSRAGSVLAQVDAVKGDLLLVQEFRMDFRMPNMDQYNVKAAPEKPVTVKDAGSVDSSTPKKTIAFALPHDGMTGNLRIQLQKMLPFDGISWEIKSAAGDSIAKGTLMAQNPNASQSWKIAAKGAGEYTLTLTYQQGSPLPTPGPGVQYDLKAVFSSAGSMPAEAPAEG